MNRFQKLAALTLATALGLVTIGVIVRATDSGPRLPRLAALPRPAHPAARTTPKAWIEWIHRTVAVVIGFEILALALVAVRDHRDRRSILLAVARRRSRWSASRHGSGARRSGSATAASR